jgi:predicted nucleic acid-binding protein
MTTAIAMTGSEIVLIDSSGWLEYITGDEKADAFGAIFQKDVQVLVPTIVLYEVLKILLLRAGGSQANVFLSEALRRSVVDLTDTIALSAASLSIDHKLPMADAIIYATAQSHHAELITSDAHFTGLPGVTVL